MRIIAHGTGSTPGFEYRSSENDPIYLYLEFPTWGTQADVVPKPWDSITEI
jgi:hypothetical protein